MSKAECNPAHKALTVRPASTDYDVGYGKPPSKTRFRPGQSGNPKGRPKGAKSKPRLPALHEERMKEILMEEAYRTIKINDGNRHVSIPMAQAVLRSLAVNAAKGNQRAQRLFTELLGSAERDNKRLHNEWLDVATTYKVEWDKELERRTRLGVSGPEPLPHPDHVHINYRTGEVQIKGPMTREEQARYAELAARKAEFQKELTELQQLLVDEPDYEYRAQVLSDIEHSKRMMELIERVIPDVGVPVIGDRIVTKGGVAFFSGTLD